MLGWSLWLLVTISSLSLSLVAKHSSPHAAVFFCLIMQNANPTQTVNEPKESISVWFRLRKMTNRCQSDENSANRKWRDIFCKKWNASMLGHYLFRKLII